jgi:hypothetical protein
VGQRARDCFGSIRIRIGRLGHRRADHPDRFLRHRAIRVEVIRGVEIDGIEAPRGIKFSRSMSCEQIARSRSTAAENTDQVAVACRNPVEY